MVTHDGMLAGLHRYRELAEARVLQRLDLEVSKVVEAHLRRASSVGPPPLGDISLVR